MTTPRTNTTPGSPACKNASLTTGRSWTSDAAAASPSHSGWPPPVTRVTGVDISDVQVERARRFVPGAVFLRADATETDFPPGSFSAVVCLYALIHIPLE